MVTEEAYTITPCPSCSVKIKHRANRPPRSCPRCKSDIARSASRSTADAAGKTISSAVSRNVARPEGLGGFLASHYKASRLHWIVPILIGLLAAGGLSLLKPRLGGGRGLVISTVAIAAAGAGCGALYVALRAIQYAFLGKRSAAGLRPSWLARIAHLCIVMLIPVVPLVVAEGIGPPQGWLAKLLHSSGSDSGPETTGESEITPKAADPLADPNNPFKVIEE